MKTSAILYRLSLLLAISPFLIAGCAKETPQVPPATLDEIAKASCLIHDGDGQGVLVGFNDRADERVFLLTARHVATYKYAPSNHINCTFGGHLKKTLKQTRDRWLTAKEGNDSAWLELSADEIAELRRDNALHYIAITNSPNTVEAKGVKGTGVRGYEEIVATTTATSTTVTLFFRNSRHHAEAIHEMCGMCTFESEYNVTYTNVRSKCICIIAPTNTPQGESGGPVFTKVKCGKQDYWMLSGLIIGGNSINPERCAVVPVDDAINDMRCCYRKLAELPELW